MVKSGIKYLVCGLNLFIGGGLSQPYKSYIFYWEGPDGNRAVIVLNACQAGRLGFKLTGIGGFAQAFLKRGAGAFVGTLWSVVDQPARTFVETFYSELLKEASLAEATITAREEARQAGDATWLAYAVYGHPHARVIRQ